MFLEVYPQVLGVSTLKRCSRCNQEKPRSEFYKSRASKDGLGSYCSMCARTKKKEWAQDNAAHVREYKREHLKNNQEQAGKARDRHRRWKDANQEAVKRKDRAYYSQNRDEINQKRRIKYANAPIEVRRAASKQAYQRQDKDRRREQNRIWRTKNTDRVSSYMLASTHRRLARKRNLPDTFTASDWRFVLDAFDGCCAVCGRQPGLWHTLAADHWIPLSSPDCPGTVAWNIVPLCHGVGGCNNSKGDKAAADWLIDALGKRKGRAILRKIEAFLESRRKSGGRG